LDKQIFILILPGAYSFIPKYEHVDELIFTDIFGNPSTVKFTEEYIVKPGFNIEVGLDKYIKDRFSVNSGIGFSYYQYKRETNLEFIENNEQMKFIPLGKQENQLVIIMEPNQVMLDFKMLKLT
jgi:hypothetical protein